MTGRNENMEDKGAQRGQKGGAGETEHTAGENQTQELKVWLFQRFKGDKKDTSVKHELGSEVFGHTPGRTADEAGSIGLNFFKFTDRIFGATGEQ